MTPIVHNEYIVLSQVSTYKFNKSQFVNAVMLIKTCYEVILGRNDGNSVSLPV